MERFTFLGGIPDAKAEDWRYSDLRKIRKEHFGQAKRPPALTVPKFGPFTRWPVVAVLNGKILGSTPIIEGVKILETARALKRFPKWAKNFLAHGIWG